MIKKITFTLLMVCFVSNAHAQQGATAPIFGIDQCIWIEDESGTVINNICGKVEVPDGAIVDNGDGSYTLDYSTGSSSDCWDEDVNSDLMPVSGSCVSATSLWEEDGNGDLMPKV